MDVPIFAPLTKVIRRNPQMGAKRIDYVFIPQFMKFSSLRDLDLIECNFLYHAQRLFDESPTA
jgi:hypothetical protein